MSDSKDARRIAAMEYLDHARPVAASNRFAVGTYERNITLYRQQMRALNLVYAMRAAADSDPANHKFDKIAVIGGGAFGSTVAAAAATIGIEVYLYERHQILLPFQRGCDTRWVNPLYYEWPAAGAESRYASLPVMNWKSGTASEVADQLAAELETTAKRTGRLIVRTGVRELRITELPDQASAIPPLRIAGRYEGNEQETVRFDAVVYATGFGVENDLGGKTSPYWRNDNLGQLDMKLGHDKTTAYLVSGVGDGGLTDIARLTVSDFHHERLFFELFDDMGEELRHSLLDLATKAAKVGRPASWLYEQLNKLATPNPNGGPFATAISRLKTRLRKDTKVELNGNAADFSEALSLQKVSFSNALLGFLLHRIGAFDYRAGKLARAGGKWSILGDADWIPPKNIVVRHGTSRDATFTSAGFADAVDPLKARTEKILTSTRLFPAGWWERNRRPPNGEPSASIASATEFAPPTTVTIATTFISTLSDILVALLKKRDPKDGRPSAPHIRMTLHRVAQFGGEEVFQQISPYRGVLLDHQKGGTGRIFRTGAGMVGLALRIGRPIVFRRVNDQLTDMETATDFSKLLAQPIEDHVDSMLACPFFAADDGTGKRRVNFVLFADTSDLAFFDDNNLKLIYAACRGFVDNIDSSLNEKRLRQISSSHAGHEVDDQISEADERRFNDVGITFDDDVFAEFQRELTFKSLRSTELDDALGVFR